MNIRATLTELYLRSCSYCAVNVLRFWLQKPSVSNIARDSNPYFWQPNTLCVRRQQMYVYRNTKPFQFWFATYVSVFARLCRRCLCGTLYCDVSKGKTAIQIKTLQNLNVPDRFCLLKFFSFWHQRFAKKSCLLLLMYQQLACTTGCDMYMLPTATYLQLMTTQPSPSDR